MPLRTGDPRSIGPYLVISRLGEGGQGVVYLAEWGGEPVAIKVLRRSGDDAVIREVNSTRQVAGFCTARIIDVRLDLDPPYIVSEYVAGTPLDRVPPRKGAELQRIAIGTATALVAIHRAGVIHRDFKPGNVLLAPDGPRVIDFGISRLVHSETTGRAIGSPPYMAPEQYSGERVTAAADVFAWGATIVFAATGRVPFGGDSIAAVAYRVLHSEPDLTGVPASLLPLVRRCLAKSPAERPTSKELLLALLGHDDEDDLKVLESGRTEATQPVARRRVPWAAVVGGALVVVALVAGFVFWPRGDRPPETQAELAAVLSEVYRKTPTATFTSEGGMGEGDNYTKSTGTVTVAGPSGLPHDDFVADITYGSEKKKRYTITDYVVVESGDSLGEFGDGTNEPPILVMATAGLTVIRSLVVQGNVTFEREGRVYRGIVPANLTGDALKLLLVEYTGDAVDRSLVTYTLTIDELNRPVSFVLDLGRPLGGAGLFTTTFRATYTNFRSR
ncbi:serine/threonine-protein kinase [Herbidospora mongoliensis]|uniref:serine/threonine-protein kinase n=1 Tax=Herbidospora mongoliensis TaxID=688067 RepID=UPI0014713F41|nr:serine/threonine-protein kinase [Herbidospora mongoliensis]